MMTGSTSEETLKEACPYLDGTLARINGDSAECSVFAGMAEGKKVESDFKHPCLLVKNGCTLDEDAAGSLNKCGEDAADKDGKLNDCNEQAAKGEEMDASCCDALDDFATCTGQTCLYLYLPPRMSDKGTRKVMEEWSKKCPSLMKR